MKMKVVVWANCQGLAVHQVLVRHFPDIRSHHFVNYQYLTEGRPLPEEFKDCDVFIYQNYGSRNDLYDLGRIQREVLPAHCQMISFPYLYFDGYWGTSRTHPRQAELAKRGFHHIFYHPLMESLRTREEISGVVARILSEDAFSKEECEATVQRSLDFLRMKEAETTVKGVAKFVEENFRRQRLFHQNRHPRGALLNLVVRQILPRLGLTSRPSYEEELNSLLDYDVQTPIPPAVVKHLSLTFPMEPARVKAIPSISTPEEFLTAALESLY